jgi:hypothetical protein
MLLRLLQLKQLLMTLQLMKLQMLLQSQQLPLMMHHRLRLPQPLLKPLHQQICQRPQPMTPLLQLQQLHLMKLQLLPLLTTQLMKPQMLHSAIHYLKIPLLQRLLLLTLMQRLRLRLRLRNTMRPLLLLPTQ